MAIIYVGPSSAGSANGTSWANRYGTLNAAEDKPVAAGDVVYVGPGTYRETLTCDISGSSGNPITYIADVTGQNTDGVGGIVRITGSDNDQTATRSNAITASAKSYRTFTGFAIDTTSSYGIAPNDATNWIIQDCACCFGGGGISFQGAGQATNTIQRCFIYGHSSNSINFSHVATVDNAGHIVENCICIGAGAVQGISTSRVGGVTVRNCLMTAQYGARVQVALTVGQTLNVYNCIITGCNVALSATTTAEFVEDYNSVFANATPRSNVTAGANSVAHSPLLDPPLLSSGIRYPWYPFALSQFSTLAAKTGSSPATLDLFGITRPATNAKNSWGPIQYQPMLRETTTTHSSSAASLRLSDAGQHQMFVPVSAVSTTFSVYVQWEADYAGTKPQMIIRQPGQADTTVTATGSSGSWEQLTTTLTPAATPGYVVVIFVSSNTATSGNYDTFFDSFTVA